MTTTLYAVSVMKPSGDFDPAPDPLARAVDESAAPPHIKAGFRNRFWHVFESASRAEGLGWQIEMWGHPVEVRSYLWARSGAERLNGLFDDNFVLVLELTPTTEAPDEFALAVKEHSPTLEKGLLDEFARATRGTWLGDTLESMDHGANKPSFKFFSTGASGVVAEALPYLLAFYHLAIVILYRIERHQWSVGVSTDVTAVDEHSMEAIALGRVMLLEYDLDFLTLNRSEHSEVLEMCDAIERDLALRTQFDREVALQASQEQHLSNVTELSQARSARSSERALTVLTVIGVPLSIVATVIAYWEFESPASVIGGPLLWTLVAAAVLVPVAVLAVFRLEAELRADRRKRTAGV